MYFTINKNQDLDLNRTEYHRVSIAGLVSKCSAIKMPIISTIVSENVSSNWL